MRLNPNTGTWELEDDSPLAVHAVEETPRAAYTEDDYEKIVDRILLAAAAAAHDKIQAQLDDKGYVDSFTQVWQELLDDVTTNIQEAIEKRRKDETAIP